MATVSGGGAAGAAAAAGLAPGRTIFAAALAIATAYAVESAARIECNFMRINSFAMSSFP